MTQNNWKLAQNYRISISIYIYFLHKHVDMHHASIAYNPTKRVRQSTNHSSSLCTLSNVITARVQNNIYTCECLCSLVRKERR